MTKSRLQKRKGSWPGAKYSAVGRSAARAILVTLVAFLANNCRGSGQQFNLPDPSEGRVTALGGSPDSGLKLTLDTTWVEGIGYRPIGLAFTNPTPVGSPLKISVRFSAVNYVYGMQTMTAEQDFEFPAGATKADFVLDVPQYGQWNIVHWDVWVNGRRDRRLSRGEEQYTSHAVAGQPLWSVLRFDPAAKSYTEDPTLGAGPQSPAVQSTQPLVNAIEGPIPDSWRRLSCFDTVVIALRDVAPLEESDPAKIAALRRWVRAGGSLVIEGRGESTDVRDEAAKRLGGLPATQTESGAFWKPLPLLGTVELDASSYYDPSSFLEQLSGSASKPSAERALVADAGFGRIIALPGPFNPPLMPSRRRTRNQNPQTEVSALGAYLIQQTWSQRHGMDPSESVDEFSDWLIPGVGAAPVTLFRVLLTLFVLVIGPLNYWLLSAYGRLHLLVITVPALAALFTVSLLIYAVLADGLGARVRVRSLTVLDRNTSEAATWARMSYYAGLTPRRGLEFPSDSAAFPIRPGWQDNMFGQSAAETRTAVMSADDQRLARGWLNARTPTQLLVVTAQDAAQRITFSPGQDGLRAANDLGADIGLLVSRDPDGAFWVARDCADSQTVTMEPLDRAKAVGALREVMSELAPQAPPGLDQSDLLGYSQARRYYRRQRFRQEATLSTNRMNTLLSAIRGTDGSNAELLPGSFVAISSTSPLVPKGLQSAEEQASMHVTIGPW